MGEGCEAKLKGCICSDNGKELSLREIQSSGGEDGQHRVLRPKAAFAEVNLWEYNGGKISGAKSNIYKTKEESKIPKEELKQNFVQLSQQFDKKMLEKQQKRNKMEMEARKKKEHE